MDSYLSIKAACCNEPNRRGYDSLLGYVLIFLIPFYLQGVQIHSANGVKLLEA
jgi:hypothetical protein